VEFSSAVVPPLNQRYITEPLTQSRAAWGAYSLNDLSSRQHVRRDREADLLGSFEIHDQINFVGFCTGSSTGKTPVAVRLRNLIGSLIVVVVFIWLFKREISPARSRSADDYCNRDEDFNYF
jgi:hypothetical protein